MFKPGKNQAGLAMLSTFAVIDPQTTKMGGVHLGKFAYTRQVLKNVDSTKMVSLYVRKRNFRKIVKEL